MLYPKGSRFYSSIQPVDNLHGDENYRESVDEIMKDYRDLKEHGAPDESTNWEYVERDGLLAEEAMHEAVDHMHIDKEYKDIEFYGVSIISIVTCVLYLLLG